MTLRDRAERAYEKTKELASEAIESDAIQELDTDKLVDAATDASGIKNREGRITKWQIAKAATRPGKTARRTAAALGKEAYAQRSNSSKKDR